MAETTSANHKHEYARGPETSNEQLQSGVSVQRNWPCKPEPASLQRI